MQNTRARNNLIISLNFIPVPWFWLIQSPLINTNGLQYNAQNFLHKKEKEIKKPGSHNADKMKSSAGGKKSISVYLLWMP